ncbi:MAG: glycosyltransferase family 39 protein [Fervidicoccaceae archaeon]
MPPEVRASSRTLKLVAFVLIMALAVYKAHACYRLAAASDWYVSDEVWYVSSARMILHEVFGIEPKHEEDGMVVYTLFASSGPALKEIEAAVASAGLRVVKGDYSEALAIAVALPPDSRDILEGLPAVKIVPGFPFPDAYAIDRYYNLEHPPLGKYIIALSIALLGDEPLSWRLPSVLEACALVLLAGATGYAALGAFGGLLAAAAAALDPLSTNMGAVAMLDIHLAFFVALALYAVVRGKFALAVLATALGIATKGPGLFALPAIYIAWRLRGGRPTIVAGALCLSLVAALITAAPLLRVLGPEDFLEEFQRALAWHTSSRPEGPPSSSPLDWFLGLNPFYLSLEPEMKARASPFIYAPVLVVGLCILPTALKAPRREPALTALDAFLFWQFFLAGFCLIYLLGNRTQYSFYAIDFAPAIYASFPSALEVLARDRSSLVESSWKSWRNLALSAVRGFSRSSRFPAELRWLEKLAKAPPSYRHSYATLAGAAALSLGLHFSVVELGSTEIVSLGERVAAMGLAPLLGEVLSKLDSSSSTLWVLDLIGLLLVLNELEALRVKARKPRRFAALVPLLSLVLYSVHDGSLFSTALSLAALNLALEGCPIRSGALMGLAANSPAAAIAAAILGMLKRDFKFLAAFVSSFLCINLFPSIAWSDKAEAISSLLLQPQTPGVASIVASLGVIGSLVFLIASALVPYALARRGGLGPAEGFYVAFASAYALSLNTLPQWLLLVLPAGALLGARELAALWAADAINALILPAWWKGAELQRFLFKFAPSSPLDPLSLPTLLSLLRSLCLLAFSARAVYQSEMRRELSQGGA